LTSTKSSSGGSGGGKAHSTPKASLPRHRAHLVSGDSASYAATSQFILVFYFLIYLIIELMGHRSTQWLRRQLSDPYVRYATMIRSMWAATAQAGDEVLTLFFFVFTPEQQPSQAGEPGIASRLQAPADRRQAPHPQVCYFASLAFVERLAMLDVAHAPRVSCVSCVSCVSRVACRVCRVPCVACVACRVMQKEGQVRVGSGLLARRMDPGGRQARRGQGGRSTGPGRRGRHQTYLTFSFIYYL
jgi:hypothetical protein